jgi:hypothetical protein
MARFFKEISVQKQMQNGKPEWPRTVDVTINRDDKGLISEVSISSHLDKTDKKSVTYKFNNENGSYKTVTASGGKEYKPDEALNIISNKIVNPKNNINIKIVDDGNTSFETTLESNFGNDASFNRVKETLMRIGLLTEKDKGNFDIAATKHHYYSKHDKVANATKYMKEALDLLGNHGTAAQGKFEALAKKYFNESEDKSNNR